MRSRGKDRPASLRTTRGSRGGRSPARRARIDDALRCHDAGASLRHRGGVDGGRRARADSRSDRADPQSALCRRCLRRPAGADAAASASRPRLERCCPTSSGTGCSPSSRRPQTPPIAAVARQAPAGDLVAVGETARRAQIESVFGDACERWNFLVPGPIAGGRDDCICSRRNAAEAYILVGTNGPTRARTRCAGFDARPGEVGQRPPAPPRSPIMPTGCPRLDFAASEFGDSNIQIGEEPLDGGGLKPAGFSMNSWLPL